MSTQDKSTHSTDLASTEISWTDLDRGFRLWPQAAPVNIPGQALVLGQFLLVLLVIWHVFEMVKTPGVPTVLELGLTGLVVDYVFRMLQRTTRIIYS